MNQRDLETRLQRSYRRHAELADPGALVERLHSIPTTDEPRRSRRWHVLGLGGSRTAGPGGIDVRGASNMLTATRIAAVVAALALGASFMAQQIGAGPEPAARPGATAGEAWTTVTGLQDYACNATTQTCRGTNHDMSDPRLEGKVAITFSYQEDADDPSVGNYTLWGDLVISNDGGTWEGNWVGFTDERQLHHITSWFEGTGEYEGLSYIEQSYEPEGGKSMVATGLLFDGDIPATVMPPVMSDPSSD